MAQVIVAAFLCLVGFVLGKVLLRIISLCRTHSALRPLPHAKGSRGLLGWTEFMFNPTKIPHIMAKEADDLGVGMYAFRSAACLVRQPAGAPISHFR